MMLSSTISEREQRNGSKPPKGLTMKVTLARIRIKEKRHESTLYKKSS